MQSRPRAQSTGQPVDLPPQSIGPAVEPLKTLIASGFVVIVVVAALLFGYWMLRVALPLTLGHTNIKSAEQIYNQHDPYYTMRKFVRQHRAAGRTADKIILVGQVVSPPSRFDLEVYYELYPHLPTKVAVGSPELGRLLADAPAGTVFIADPALDLNTDHFDQLTGENYMIYVRR